LGLAEGALEVSRKEDQDRARLRITFVMPNKKAKKSIKGGGEVEWWPKRTHRRGN